ncbi:uncharacterized protein LOC134192876 isoform X2 [Corticium candelabrum]|uniref:uncharacterized protein LOC134192876 isoform X2 n=1 Tax=Corticium candelabrum TaxID=121492 RepID=UPI002E25ADE0|nr:uncharacterized protein LOC134192876 isoform X2 [Corticium candelabrum]
MSTESRLLFDLSLCRLRDDDDGKPADDSHQYIDIISLLPTEIAVLVLELLTSKDLYRVQQVSKIWRSLAQHPQLQLRIREYKLSCMLRKENSTSDRLCRRFSTGMINRNLDSPFASLQAASPTLEENAIRPSSSQGHTSETLCFIDRYDVVCRTREHLAIVRPQPVAKQVRGV